MRDPYSILGVAKSARPDEIKSAYRKLAKKYHPDRNKDDPKAKERFSEASQAYEILGDKELKAKFDRGEIDAEGKSVFQGFSSGSTYDASSNPFADFARRAESGSGTHFEFRSGSGGFSGAEDILSNLFGNAQGGTRTNNARGNMRGNDLTATLEITLEQVVGAHKVEAVFPNGRHLAIKLPGYVEDSQTIRLKGQGESISGGTPGDALVTIRFKHHSKFRIEDRNLHIDLPVSLTDAVLGARLEVETLEGRVAVRIPSWSSSDCVLRLKQKGLPKKTGERADLFVHVRIMLPKNGDADLEALLKKRVV